MPDLVTARQNEDVWLTLFAEYPVFRCISQNLSPGWPIFAKHDAQIQQFGASFARPNGRTAL